MDGIRPRTYGHNSDRRIGNRNRAAGHRRGIRRDRFPCARSVLTLAHRTGSSPRGVGPSDRGPVEAAQDRVGRARHARDGEDQSRGRGGSPGDDRHLRLRHGSIPSAIRAHDRLRTAGSPDDGAVASPRGRGSHQRIQFPRSCLELECGARVGVRGYRAVEAGESDAPHGHRRNKNRPGGL